MTPLHDNQQTRSTEISKNGHKVDKPDSMVNPDPESSSSESSSKTSSSDSISREKKHNKKKKGRKHRKDDSSDPSLSDDSDSSDEVITDANDAKKKRHQKKDPIKLCASLTEKLLTTAYKSKIIRFKMDEDPLQRWIYFLTFVESPEMIFYNTQKLVKYF